MKKLKKLNISPLHKTFIFFGLSLLFFLSAFLIFSDSYKLSNYSNELKEYGINYKKVFDFDASFNSYSIPGNLHVKLEKDAKKVIIKVPSGDINVYPSSSDGALQFYGYATVSRTYNHTNSFNVNYLEKTKIHSISCFNEIPSDKLYHSSLEINVPEDFKGEIIIQTTEGNVLNHISNPSVKLKVEALK